MNLFELDALEFYYCAFVIFVIGACLGSFLNVVILRAFSGESIVLPPSKCPKCHNKLKWYHNIPILSYIFLQGKCGFCKAKISIQYPLVEIVFALLFLSVFLKFGITLNALFLTIAAAMCLVLAVTDIREKVIFDNHAYILGVIGLVYNFFDIGKSGLGAFDFNIFSYQFSLNKSFMYSVLGIIAGFALMEALAFVGKLFVGTRAFGEGDSFILGALGAVFRLQSVLLILLYGCVIQIVLILPLFVKKLFDDKEYKLIWALVGFVLSVGLFKFLDVWGLIDNIFVLASAFLLMCICAFFACRLLVNSAKTGKSLTYVPFGPPLVLAALLLMFI